MATEFPELVDQKVAARLLGRSTVSLWRLRKEARIAFYRIGRKAMYDKADLAAYIKRQRREAND